MSEVLGKNIPQVKRYCCIVGLKGATALVYKNIKYLFIYLVMVKWLYERERERESRSGTMVNTTSSDLHQVVTDIFSLSSLCFFHGILIQDWFSIWVLAIPRLASKIASLLIAADCSLCCLTANSLGWKLPLLYIFQGPMHSSCAIYVAFPLSLVYLKTHLHVLFLKSMLTSLSKVNM